MMGMIDHARQRAMLTFLPEARALALVDRMIPPAARALAAGYAAKVRMGEAVMPAALRMAHQVARQGGAAKVYGLPLLAT